ncbi:MAG: gamma-glutamyl-phosphate reductase, partial [Synechococcales bacterium]|nr:gamma-glutamyl-phosphate reductase [Synechococcales bacterium]
SQRLIRELDSAAVYVNTSPRFCRLPSPRGAVSLGMSTRKGPRRGHIRLESLMSVKQILRG